ncbi:hypothetical protein ACFP2T_43285 [Plantactinospora solaniradicis]|uniref:Uncharacterized protein n=1 Tax=Plantactinospora solaniradicis TaxID=1723736 RepID=A0ABW1KPA8_9ACTN
MDKNSGVWRRIAAATVSAVVACVGLVVGAPAAASASPSIASPATQRSQVARVAPGLINAVVSCSAGKVATGGGAAVVGEPAGEHHVSIKESGPGSLGGKSVWLTSLLNGDIVAHQIRFYAVCIDPPVGYETVVTSVSVPGNTVDSISAMCPASKRVIGGGVQVMAASGNPSAALLQESAPNLSDGIRWAVMVKNTAATPRTFLVTAVCAKTPAGYVDLSQDLQVNPGSLGWGTLACPSGTRPLSGGARVTAGSTGDHKTVVAESAPYDVALLQKGWVAAMRNNDSVARWFQRSVICVTAPLGYEITSVLA